MSKPELPKRIDPLPAPKPADAKKDVPKMPGWEPPTPQKVRSSERKMGMLLAVSLLAAIGFVAYRKYDAIKSRPPVDAEQFVKTDKGAKPPASDGKSAALANAAAETPPVAALPPWAGPKAETGDAGAAATPADMRIAATDVSVQSQPAFTTGDAGTTADTTWATQPAEPPAQAEPAQSPPEQTTWDLSNNTTSGDGGGTVSGDTATSSTETLTTDAVANPFAGDVVVSTESAPPQQPEEANTFSSDAASPFGAQTESNNADGDVAIVSSDPPTQPGGEPAGDATVADMPAIDLFAQPVAESAPAQQPEAEKSLPPAGSPFGDAPSGDQEQSPPVEAAAPQLLEPNDPQVMPPLDVEPFGKPAAETETVTSEPATTAVAPPTARDPFPLGAGEVRIQQRSPRGVSREEGQNPFSKRENATLVERSPAAVHDPFTPARDVNQAVREDQVAVHEVQTGDNYWKIAQRYYGSGTSFNALAAYNQSTIPDPERMKPGMRVLVPSEAVLAQQFPKLMSGASQTYEAAQTGPAGFSLDAQGRPQYRVAKGDTLSNIAVRYLGRASRWRQLYGMNMDQLVDADSLTTGMLLRLPTDARQVRMDGGATFGR